MRNSQKTAAVLDAHPELWTPEALRPFYDTAVARTAATRVQDVGDPQTALRSTVAALLAERRGLAFVPGSVPKPDLSRTRAEYRPLGESSIVLQQVDVSHELTADEQAARARYLESEHLKDDFAAEVDTLTAEILADPAREFAAWRHFLALGQARAMAAEAERAERNRQAIAERDTCPVCGEINGAVKQRDITQPDGAPPRYARPRVGLRSCTACATVAYALHVNALAAARTADGTTRRDRVTAALLHPTD